MGNVILVVRPQEMHVINAHDLPVLNVHHLLVQDIPPEAELAIDLVFLEPDRGSRTF